MSGTSDGLPRSVQVRLVRHAQELGVDPNLILTRFAMERFLYRLSRSPYADRFVLKGALLLVVWLGESIRPTRDADLLGFGDLSDVALESIFREVCAVEVEPDAMTYLRDSIRIAAIRPEDAYGGKRVTLQSRLGPARLRVQVDVGIGDVVTPEPVWLDYPSLLEFPRARLLAYRPETAIVEKFHAMVTLGSKNSRMRDFFDVDALAEREPFDRQPLVEALPHLRAPPHADPVWRAAGAHAGLRWIEREAGAMGGIPEEEPPLLRAARHGAGRRAASAVPRTGHRCRPSRI